MVLNRFTEYSSSRGTTSMIISDSILKLVKYVISSNSPITELKNKGFLDILDKEIKNLHMSYGVFRNKILPEVVVKLERLLTSKLNKASQICLITDIWTNRSNADFIAIGAVLVSSDLSKELHIIGLDRMKGEHNSENIQASVEEIVNRFEFDKIVGVCCDEGSSLLR